MGANTQASRDKRWLMALSSYRIFFVSLNVQPQFARTGRVWRIYQLSEECSSRSLVAGREVLKVETKIKCKAKSN
jgi:hypothetical protein